jgi:hypothetical protein
MRRHPSSAIDKAVDTLMKLACKRPATMSGSSGPSPLQGISTMFVPLNDQTA